MLLSNCQQNVANITEVINMLTWLRDLRVKRGLTQKEVANIIGVSVQAYNFYENSKRKISFEVAQDIASALDFDVIMFFDKIKSA